MCGAQCNVWLLPETWISFIPTKCLTPTVSPSRTNERQRSSEDLKKSVDEGKVSEETITQACRRILVAKYKLGLFKDPYKYSDSKRPKRDILTDANKKLAREAARKSFVLFKNENNTLPLSKTAKIALVGPLADSKNNMLGTWAPTGDPQLSVSILEGLKNVAPNARITYAKGANISNDTSFAKKVNVFGPRLEMSEESPEALLAEALKAAENADVIVAVVGEASEMSGEAASRTDISIPESQKVLIRELAKTGKPVVLALMSGRPLVITEELDLPVSILQIWHPGIEAGNAVADVLFGDYNPSGKLTATWPRNVGQIPIYHSEKNTGRPAPSEAFEKFKSQYLDAPNAPLLAFGFGISYTTFDYKNLQVSKKEIAQGEAIEVRVDVTNTGAYDGTEIVQLYLHDVVRSLTPPMRTLKGFENVFLKKGETKTVVLTLEADDLKFYNGSLDFVAEAGEFEIFVGGDSNASLKETFTLN